MPSTLPSRGAATLEVILLWPDFAGVGSVSLVVWAKPWSSPAGVPALMLRDASERFGGVLRRWTVTTGAVPLSSELGCEGSQASAIQPEPVVAQAQHNPAASNQWPGAVMDGKRYARRSPQCQRQSCPRLRCGFVVYRQVTECWPVGLF